MRPDRTLVLMADDAEARFLINQGPGTGLTEHACLMADQFPDLAIGHEDRAGRHTGGGSPGHSIDPRDTIEVQRRERFAQHVARALDQEWRQVRADRLVVAAPPKMLGILRKALSGPAAAALAGDLAKNLLNTPAIDLPKHFAGLVKV
jgi:protein required for attachment to host cells